eukprot:201400-Amphidinium_carterae.1
MATRWENGRPTFGLALDASKAFPSLRRSALGYIARRIGFPPQLWEALQSHYQCGDTVWRLAGQWVGVERLRLLVGISQGCPLSVVLYNLFTLPLVQALSQRGVLILAYADDITLVADSREELYAALNTVVEYLDSGGIRLNLCKSQYFTLHGDPSPLVVEGTSLLPQPTVCILGHTVRMDYHHPLPPQELPLEELGRVLERAYALGLPMHCRGPVLAMLVAPRLLYQSGRYAITTASLKAWRNLVLRFVAPSLVQGPRLAIMVLLALSAWQAFDPWARA